MIDEKGLCAAMKAAWRTASGYKVTVQSEMIGIAANNWAVQVPLRALPRKALALLVEHIGEIPTDGAAYGCQKDVGAQTLVAAFEQEHFRSLEAYFREALPQAKETQLTLREHRIWQAPETMQVIAVSTESLRLVDRKTLQDAAFVIPPMEPEAGALLQLTDDEGGRIWIIGIAQKEPDMQYIAGFPWVE